MTDNLLHRFASIGMYSRGGKRAPHKPLLLLYALSKMKHENVERITYNDAERFVNPLIQLYGPFGARAMITYPFARLANDNDNIWWIENIKRNAAGDFKLTEARERNIEAGFSEDVLAAFRSDPNLIDIIALNLLWRHFSPILHAEICNAIGLCLDKNECTYDNRRRRDPRFRMDVLRAYRDKCCVCKFDIKMKGEAVALEAAHIKMHSAGGPDLVNNGLSLCAIHHRLFDYGAITIDKSMRIRVSEGIVGDWGKMLKDGFHEKEIFPPCKDTMLPTLEYIRWHNDQVFKGMMA